MDVVIQYAIHGLGFQPKNIALFAWSIGGYPASWAAKNYPDIQFVVGLLLFYYQWRNLICASI